MSLRLTRYLCYLDHVRVEIYYFYLKLEKKLESSLFIETIVKCTACEINFLEQTYPFLWM